MQRSLVRLLAVDVDRNYIDKTTTGRIVFALGLARVALR